MKKFFKPRLIIYIAIIVVIIALTLIFFSMSRNFKVECSAYNVSIIKCRNELETLTEGTPAYIAKMAELTHFQSLKDAAGIKYNVFAYLSYGFSMLFLISVGLIVNHSTKIKEKEDNAVAAAQ